MKLELIRKYDLEKLVLGYWSLTITLFIYVLISGNHLHIVVTNPKLNTRNHKWYRLLHTKLCSEIFLSFGQWLLVC